MIKTSKVNQAEREAIVGRYRASGLSQREFCAREGVNYCSFQWWLSVRRRQAVVVKGKPLAKVTPRLLPVRVGSPRLMARAPEAPKPPIEAELGRGVVLRFSEQNDSGYVARLLRNFLSLPGGVLPC